jgi:Tfp pilus assembly PilM family ATPase
MISFISPGPIGRLLRRGSSRTAVGIDAGTRSFKALQLERTRAGKARVVAAAVKPRIPVDGALSAGAVSSNESDALALALSSAGFSGQRIVLAAPSDAVLVTPLELPPRSSNAPLDQLARMEIARNFRCAPDSFEMSWWEMPAGMRGGRGTEALAVAFPHARADSLLDAFEHPGLEVEAIETEQTAIIRACKPMLAENDVTAILDLGWGPATLGFIHHQTLTFSRRIPEGAIAPLHANLCKTLSVDADVVDYLLGEVGVAIAAPGGEAHSGERNEAVEMPDEGARLVATFAETLVKELFLSFSYATHQYPDTAVSKLLLVGGGAGMAGLAARLASTLGVEVTKVAPADVTECDSSLLGVCASPAMTLALGLAMRELE